VERVSGSAVTAPIALGRVGKSTHVQGSSTQMQMNEAQHMHKHRSVETTLTRSRAPHITNACTHHAAASGAERPIRANAIPKSTAAWTPSITGTPLPVLFLRELSIEARIGAMPCTRTRVSAGHWRGRVLVT
jgi:hypothetical protein